MIVPEQLVRLFIFPVTTISVLANLTLITIISSTHVLHVGAYRYLLLSFAVVDILISIVHFLVVPGIQMTEFGFIFFGFRFIGEATVVGMVTDLIFIALFYQTFVLLVFHYAYRYLIICDPAWRNFVSGNHPWRNWIAIALTVDAMFIGGYMVAIKFGGLPNDSTRAAFAPMLKAAYNIDLLAPNRPGYLCLAYRLRQRDGSLAWHIQSLACLLLTQLLFMGSAIIIVLCTWHVMKKMESTKAQMATRTRLMQQQLFRTLIIQTIVPAATSYLPLGTNFVLPLTGISLGGLGTVIMMSTALFPLIDPFLVLFLVSGYRARLPTKLLKILLPSVSDIEISSTYTGNTRN